MLNIGVLAPLNNLALQARVRLIRSSIKFFNQTIFFNISFKQVKEINILYYY